MKFITFAQTLILVTLFSFSSFSQDDKSINLKLYSNFEWRSTYQIVDFDTTNNVPISESNHITDLGYFSPAVAFKTANGNYHEFELSKLQFNRRDELTLLDPNSTFPQVVDGERTTNLFIAMRYEYDLSLFKQRENKKLSTSIGFGARPYYSNSVFNPRLSNEILSSESIVGSLFSITPHLKCQLGERWFLDLNIPINFAGVKLSSVRVEDPTIPVAQRSISTIHADILPKEYLVRFGVGLKL